MERDDRLEALKHINALQSNGTASVTIQVGGANNDGMVEHDSLYIKNAPSKVVDALSEAGFRLSVTDCGVRVEV